MIKNVLFGLIGFLTGFILQAKEVSLQDAQKAGVGFYFERVNQYKTVNYHDILVLDSYTCARNGLPIYHVFNLSPGGFVIVAADNAVIPVLGYAFEGRCDEEHQPPQFKAWMKQYEDQIVFARQIKTIPDISAQNSWEYYLSTAPQMLKPFKTQQAVEPMLTSKWNQNIWYNEGCPADPGGPGGHALAGCVPAAMGQLMYYFRWPESGVGSYSYLDSTYGILSADFENSTYNWNNMVNSINSSNPDIAQLIFHLGVSCDLRYGPSGSGMYNHKAAYSLRTYFKYSPQTQYLYRDSTNLDWDSIMVAHLNWKIPMYYAGWSVPNINGHAFICDGYQDTAYFHFNFGWSGSSDGYFYSNNIVAGGGSFNLAQELIINCYPDTINYSYPPYCIGATSFTRKSGTFEDGSGPARNYQSPSGCSWLIAPEIPDDSVSSITLSFQRFSTLLHDSVAVYDGSSTSSPLLGRYSGDDIPQAITSTGNKMLVTFIAKSDSTAPGWFASYSSNIPVWCSGQTLVTADTFEISDGSLEFNYHNNTNCRWKISHADSTPVTIYFRSMDTEPGRDFLRVFDILHPKDTLASLSGYFDPANLPDSVTAPKGQMMIVFTSNSTITAKGWEIYYPKSHVGIADPEEIRGLEIFPNPARNQATVRFDAISSSTINVRLSSVDGREISSQNTSVQTGKNEVLLDISGLKAGIYLVQVGNGSFIRNKKLVIH